MYRFAEFFLKLEITDAVVIARCRWSLGVAIKRQVKPFLIELWLSHTFGFLLLE